MIQFSYLHYLLIQIQSYTIKSNNSLPPMIWERTEKINTLFHIYDINFTTLVDEYNNTIMYILVHFLKSSDQVMHAVLDIPQLGLKST